MFLHFLVLLNIQQVTPFFVDGQHESYGAYDPAVLNPEEEKERSGVGHSGSFSFMSDHGQ